VKGGEVVVDYFPGTIDTIRFEWGRGGYKYHDKLNYFWKDGDEM